MRWAVFFLFILVLVCQVSAFQIVEFCPDTYLPGDNDEYIIIEGDGNLDGVIITDGEGGFRFPAGTRIQGRSVIARMGASFLKSHGHLPDFEWEDSMAAVPDVVRSGQLRLANARDQLQLLRNGIILQEIEWPGDVVPRQGQVHFLNEGLWDQRIILLGQSRFEPERYEEITGIGFVSPDCSFAVFETAVSGAKENILVNVYEFTSQRMADLLITARNRGVNITVLIEGGPVGGISAEEQSVIFRLAGNGIRVIEMTSTGDSHAPYRFNHAKYMVIDRCRTFITSENFKENGFPGQGMIGNRGWGVYLESEQMASYFTNIFEFDCNGGWVREVYGQEGPNESLPEIPYRVEFQPLSFTCTDAVPVISPDTSSMILEMIEEARVSIDIEQAYITNSSDQQLNPFLDAAVNASRRGVKVRVLLDSYWYNVEDTNDNDEMAALINSISLSESLPLEARCAGLEPNNLEKIHNKGVIVDLQKVLVSSINWNDNSPNFNREAGIIISDPVAAAYFSSVFEDDWNASSAGEADSADYLKYAITGVVIFLLIVIYMRRRR